MIARFLRQCIGVLVGMLAALLVHYLIMSLVLLVATGAPGGGYVESVRTLSDMLRGTGTGIAIAVQLIAVMLALVAAGYVAVWIGRRPAIPLGMFASLVMAGLVVRAVERQGGAELEWVALTGAAIFAASSGFGGFLRARHVRDRPSH